MPYALRTVHRDQEVPAPIFPDNLPEIDGCASDSSNENIEHYETGDSCV